MYVISDYIGLIRILFGILIVFFDLIVVIFQLFLQGWVKVRCSVYVLNAKVQKFLWETCQFLCFVCYWNFFRDITIIVVKYFQNLSILSFDLEFLTGKKLKFQKKNHIKWWKSWENNVQNPKKILFLDMIWLPRCAIVYQFFKTFSQFLIIFW